MATLSSRITALEESATMAITAKAKALRAEGRDVIGFGAGEPDFPTPDHIVEAAQAAAADPASHHYTGVSGDPALREEIVRKTCDMTGLDYSPSQVTVTNGAKHAVFDAFAAILDEGDEVLVPAPYWVTYPEVISWLGGVPVPVPTDEESGFLVSADQLEAARTERTKALLVVSPSNPTGAVYDPAQAQAIADWAAGTDLWVVTDDIYGELVYDDTVFTSVPGAVPGLAERSLILNGVSKSYAMTGWRVGWVVGPQEAITYVNRLQGHQTSNVANVAQAAALAALTGPTGPIDAMRAVFDRRRHAMFEQLSAIDGVDVCEPHGAFYCFPSFKRLFGSTIRGRIVESSMDVADLLLAEAEVAIVPGEAFGAPGYARLSYALADDALKEGVSRIRRVLEDR